MTDTSHLAALETRLSHERSYFAKDGAGIRKVWIAQIEKEIAAEIAFLAKHGITVETVNADDPNMSDDDLLAALLD